MNAVSSPSLIPGFQCAAANVNGVSIRYAMGGKGPALLLLHGHPQTHVLWHRVAPQLAQRYRVIAADLRAAGQPTTFRVHAEDKDGKLVSVQLFAKGYLRAEAKVDAAQTDQTFTLSNLFEGDNTLIATAVDNDGLVGLSAPVRVKVKSTQSPKK